MSGKFIGYLDVRELGNGKWQLLSPLQYYTSKGELIEVPVGFVTDFYSTPVLLRWLVPKVQRQNRPAALHDFLYRTGKIGGRPIERKEADDILKEAKDMCNHDHLVTLLIYQGVRIGGGYRWKQLRGQDKV